jgi:hypothetical protein
MLKAQLTQVQPRPDGAVKTDDPAGKLTAQAKSKITVNGSAEGSTFLDKMQSSSPDGWAKHPTVQGKPTTPTVSSKNSSTTSPSSASTKD